MVSARSRQPYDGSRRKLVLAFDIGTTYSGISYSLLDPGEVPKVWTVTTFPGQTDSGGDSKVPSLLYYDSDGLVRAVGEEAENLSENGEAEDNEWIKVEWFKLHLRPRDMRFSRIADNNLPVLPENKTVIDVFADFMAYLYKCARDYIQNTHGAGDEILRSVEGHIEFVMGHPNGWGGAQQQKMRRAAVVAGLVPDTQEGHSRVHFVTEGEASLHYCLGNGLSFDVIQKGTSVMIVDAGGGTIDLSSFIFREVLPMTVEEVASPGCCLQGSVFVNQRASAFLLEKKLRGSSYDDPQDVERIVKCFDKTVKRRFRKLNEPAFIRFGTNRDDDADFGIKKGVLKLTGGEVAAFFEPSIKAILEAIDEQQRMAQVDFSAIFLVGGYAANDWLFHNVRERMQACGVWVSRPDGYTNKAVADGALSFYLDHFVSTRIARVTYGIRGVRTYIPWNSQHASRSVSVTIQPSGKRVLPRAYFSIVPQGTKVPATQEFTKNFTTEGSEPSELTTKIIGIICYRGNASSPEWTDIEPDMFYEHCVVMADTSLAANALSPRRGTQGQIYYLLEFKVIMQFGLTELKAQIAWMENGEEKRSPATIVYEGEEEAVSVVMSHAW